MRVLQHDKSIVVEDDLDNRWEEATGEIVNEVIFLSRHTAVSNRPALTVHPIGTILHSFLYFVNCDPLYFLLLLTTLFDRGASFT